ncbi:MAG: hypothetical protein VYB54_07475 [Pseudomonadota bacterium]|nr:hypothetical protein [Pseudomonadota bacterium]
MSRGLSSAMVDAVTGRVLRPVIFFEGEFASGTVRLFSGIGSLTWDSKTWTGAGKLAGLEAIEETDSVEARGMAVSLNGFDSALVSIALAEVRQGKAGKVWIGFFDTAGAVIADPKLAFSGRLDVPSLTDSGETARIVISYENRLIDLERPRLRLYTQADQKIDYPTDTGMRFIESLQEAEVLWGRR